MVALRKEYVSEIVDEVIHAVKSGNNTAALPQELVVFENVLRAMGSLLTVEQCQRLSDMVQIKKILEQDNEPLSQRISAQTLSVSRPSQIRSDWMLYWPRA